MNGRFETFTLSILELNRFIQKIKDIEMKKFGLRGGHTMCLYYLGKHPEGLTVTGLTELCLEDKAAISRSISQLLKKGFVTCTFPEGKRTYRTLYYLTGDGEKVVSSILSRIEAALSVGGSGLSDDDRRVLYSSMTLILNNLKRHIEEIEKCTT